MKVGDRVRVKSELLQHVTCLIHADFGFITREEHDGERKLFLVRFGNEMGEWLGNGWFTPDWLEPKPVVQQKGKRK